MQGLEIAAATLGVANIILLVRRSIWNYPFGLAMVAAYMWVFAEARLYSDAALQVMFFGLQIYGWWNWQAAQADTGEVLVERLGAVRLLAVLTATLAGALAWGSLVHLFTDAAYPFLDAANAAFSIAAQVMLARRLIENWPVWIGVDMLAIGLYVSRGLLATAALYALMLVLCVAGWRAWRQAAGAQAAARAA